MTPRLPLSIACLACFSTVLLGACDSGRVMTMPGDDEVADSVDPSEPGAPEEDLVELEDYTENIELPADESVEPTGQACETWSAAAACLDGKSAAFCSFNMQWEEGAPDFVFGGCTEFDEVECWPGDTRNVQTECGVMAVGCSVWDDVPQWETAECWDEDEGGDTPLVLRFDSAPIEMIASEATPAATFDIAMAADGNSCITTDWPSAATPWLAVDLDGNGNIDGGHELFGSGTELSVGGKAQNGFIALAEYDANHDGKVDGEDPRFGELLLWRDYDGDRRSNPAELEPLAESGVDSLTVSYAIERSCDARGNCEIERSSFSHAGGQGELVDLHLACQ